MAQTIGAQAAFPCRQVISLSGDGEFVMLIGDFLSLPQLRPPVKVVVLNNGTIGFIEIEQKSTRFLGAGTELQNPNFAAMAEAVGVRGNRLEDMGDVEAVNRLRQYGPIAAGGVGLTTPRATAAPNQTSSGNGARTTRERNL
ncbi:MAG: thiamine pyrophosphate-dependent enzyme [Methylocella sp.]